MRLVPIRHAGVLARDFCGRIRQAAVEAVFARSLCLRAGPRFLCVGAREIGNGPLTLTGDMDVARLALMPGQPAAVCERHVTIGGVRFCLEGSDPWQPPAWPSCPPRPRLRETCRRLRDAAEPGGLARAPFDRAARERVARFGPGGLIGLGPGLTPSGDDVLSGMLAMLDALGERRAHAQLARAVAANLAATSALSGAFLMAVAAGHAGEHLHRMVSSVLTGDIDAALAIASRIGHSSGWDMLDGITSTALQAAHAPAA